VQSSQKMTLSFTDQPSYGGISLSLKTVPSYAWPIANRPSSWAMTSDSSSEISHTMHVPRHKIVSACSTCIILASRKLDVTFIRWYSSHNFPVNHTGTPCSQQRDVLRKTTIYSRKSHPRRLKTTQRHQRDMYLPTISTNHIDRFSTPVAVLGRCRRARTGRRSGRRGIRPAS